MTSSTPQAEPLLTLVRRLRIGPRDNHVHPPLVTDDAIYISASDDYQDEGGVKGDLPDGTPAARHRWKPVDGDECRRNSVGLRGTDRVN